MKTVFILQYKGSSDVLTVARLASPESEMLRSFAPGDTVCFFKGFPSFEVINTDNFLYAERRVVNIRTQFLRFPLELEKRGWTFLEGREEVVRLIEEADKKLQKQKRRA